MQIYDSNGQPYEADLVEGAKYRDLLTIISASDYATTVECTCGGNPAESLAACPACRVYHRVEAAKRAVWKPDKI